MLLWQYFLPTDYALSTPCRVDIDFLKSSTIDRGFTSISGNFSFFYYVGNLSGAPNVILVTLGDFSDTSFDYFLIPKVSFFIDAGDI